MITIADLESLKNNDGMTLKNGAKITYKTGWQPKASNLPTQQAHSKRSMPTMEIVACGFPMVFTTSTKASA